MKHCLERKSCICPFVSTMVELTGQSEQIRHIMLQFVWEKAIGTKTTIIHIFALCAKPEKQRTVCCIFCTSVLIFIDSFLLELYRYFCFVLWLPFIVPSYKWVIFFTNTSKDIGNIYRNVVDMDHYYCHSIGTSQEIIFLFFVI